MALIKIVLNSVKNRLIGRVTGGAAIGTIRFFGVVANSTFKGVAMRSGMHNTLHKQLLRQLSTTPRSEVEALKQTALEYDRISKATLESLSDALDNLAESKEGHDLEYSAGVMSFTTPKGVFVINKQPPSRQLWLSSPISGPLQFSYHRASNEWLDIRGSGKTLRSVLKEELGIEFEIFV